MDKVSFDVAPDLNQWLRKEAFKLHLSKSAFIAALCSHARGATAYDSDDAIGRTVAAAIEGEITQDEAICTHHAILAHARQDTRAAVEAEWAGVNNDR